ncbi:Rieske 2Fe-2S domain-containing protein [Variovorax dokdonensis]|uniref:Rieske 2Fe-2S domain-containing protein n=1 Tax=Variovorax dokdonensis TaxID=344883 RepID=UPI0036F294B9
MPSTDVAPASDVVAAFAQGQELAVWRSEAGSPQVWENRCPHRSVRLTLGQVVDGRLSCAYHGWSYAADSAQCERIPAHPDRTPPANLCVKTFACAERGGIVWARLDSPEAPATEPPLHPLPEGWQALRTLSVRASATATRLALAQFGWQRDGGDVLWLGALDGQPAQALLLEAQPELTMLHLRCETHSDLRARHAAARQLRAQIEAVNGGKP